MFVGRDDEITDVRGDLADRGIVVLTGPAGIGKTTLARAAVHGTGPCAEGGALATLSWVPYLVFRRILDQELVGAPSTVARAVARRGFRTIVLDDLQWADDASLDVLAELAGSVRILATVRSGEERSRYTVDALACLGGVEVPVGPLPEPAARKLVEAVRPDLADTAVEILLDLAAGNPLLLGALDTTTRGAPDLSSALMARVDGLTPRACDALDRLVVLGRPADAALLGPGTEELLSTPLVREENGLVSIRHALLGEVLVDAMGARAHRVRGMLAAEVDDGEAAHLLAAAGDRSQARERALVALSSTRSAADRLQLLELVIGCAAEGCQDIPFRLEASELACDLSRFAKVPGLCTVPTDDPVERGSLKLMEARAAWQTADLERCERLIEQALCDLSGSETPAEAFALAGSTILATRIFLDGRPVLERAREAVALADRVGAHQQFARLRLASVLSTSGESGWDELYRSVISDAIRRGDRSDARIATTSLALAHWMTGDAHTAYALFRDDVDRGPGHDHDGLWLASHAYMAVIGLLTGVPAPVTIRRHRFLLDEEPKFRNRAILVAAVGVSLVDLGRAPDAEDLTSQIVDGPTARPADHAIGHWLRAEIAWASGRFEEVVAIGRACRGDLNHPAAAQARLLGRHAARQNGQGIAFGTLPMLAPGWQGANTEWQALDEAASGNLDAAIEGFDIAARQWEDQDVRSHTRCLWAAGELAAATGAPDATDRLSAAAEAAEGHGLFPLADRCRAALRLVGTTGRAHTRVGSAGLTARETSALRLVGDGCTSVQIAAALSVSVSTVNSSIRNAVQKLGVTNRIAAAAELATIDQDPG